MNTNKILKSIGITEHQLLDQEESIKIFTKWKKEFCPALKFKIKNYLWEEIQSKAIGKQAIDEYRSLNSLKYYVMLEPTESSIDIALSSEKPLVLNNSCTELYIFPKNMAWCMCFTHEDGYIGPVYAESSDFKEKQHKNEQAVIARKNGYL